jgi:protoporphyrinogen oxidase
LYLEDWGLDWKIMSKAVLSGKKVLVLGGGLSGLTFTYQAARRFPNTHFTLVEKSNRFGGWVNSKKEGTPTFQFEKVS